LEEEMKERKRISRREFLQGAALVATAAAASACCPTTEPEVIREEVEVTRVVEGEGETVVEQVIVTATPVPMEEVEAEDVLGVLPRNETLIADKLTGRIGSPSNFNSWQGWKWRDRGTQQLTNEPLWSVDFATGEIVPGLAAGDPSYNDDFTVVTIPLREGVAWDDGTPFTAEDVVFTIETLRDTEGLNAYSFFSENVDSVTALDDYTVEITLNAPNSRFHTTFLDRWGCTWIMPKHIFEGEEDKINFEFDPPVGCGPYKLHSYDDAGFWTIFEKREDWDKSPGGILYGEPVPQYVVLQNFATEGAKILAQLTHQCDALNLSSDGLKAVLAQSDTSRAYQPTFPWVVNNDPCITGITYNTARAPYDNPDVRWALTLAINIAEHIGLAVDGAGTMSPVHIPHLGSYPQDYIGPMQDWLSNLEIDLGDGEMFQVYDPDAPARLVEYVESRGYSVPEDQETLDRAFGIGWYKYAPEAAEKLLINNGFSKDADGKWLMPDGSPWRIEFMTGTELTHPGVLNANAAVAQWQKFGIDASVYNTENNATLIGEGDYDVSSSWPATEPWGAGPDLYRTLNNFKSEYYVEVGEPTNGHASRWNSPEMDAVIEELMNTDPADYEAVVAVGTEGLKLLVESMPGTPTFGYIGFISWDEFYWTNWPGSENPYTQPYTHWGPFKYMTPSLESTGR
jgi:peptide/nickel transport system substrate-binding protein